MIQVMKENRVLDILETDKAYYLSEGYDVLDENGKVVEKATGGKMYTAAEYNAVLLERDKLKEQVAKLTKKQSKGKPPEILETTEGE